MSNRAFCRFAWVLLLVAAVSVGACRPEPPPLDDLGQVPDFSFVDQESKPIGMAQLKGKPWVANFVFTTCTTACPPLAQASHELQDKIKTWSKAPYPKIVSITVDPITDDPARLKVFADRYSADHDVWRV